mmetsp:Transcript_20127/g.57686  ORF Transcript_20127/g.57686 Transcript_20127/m.57686 type:complete len:197 (-) Transcript_20127:314-904(-)
MSGHAFPDFSARRLGATPAREPARERAREERSHAADAEQGEEAEWWRAERCRAEEAEDRHAVPQDDYFKRLEAEQEKHKCVGSMLIVGVDSGGSDDESEPDEEPEYTAEQILQLRHILITEARAKALEKADDFCSCGQSAGGFAMFNTSDGNQICAGIPKEVQAALKKKTLPERFDALFALTHGLKNYDFWMNERQ